MSALNLLQMSQNSVKDNSTSYMKKNKTMKHDNDKYKFREIKLSS
jgi:hypothetical protein